RLATASAPTQSDTRRNVADSLSSLPLAGGDRIGQGSKAMVTHRVVKAVLKNFLGTYTSRYSDYCGYWLFGFLVGDLDEVQFDLLTRAGGNQNTPRAVATLLAATKFADQMCKAGLKPSQFRDARLRIKKLMGTTEELVN